MSIICFVYFPWWSNRGLFTRFRGHALGSLPFPPLDFAFHLAAHSLCCLQINKNRFEHSRIFYNSSVKGRLRPCQVMASRAMPWYKHPCCAIKTCVIIVSCHAVYFFLLGGGAEEIAPGISGPPPRPPRRPADPAAPPPRRPPARPPARGPGQDQAGNLEIWELEIWKFEIQKIPQKNSQNQNPCCPRCRQGLDW